MENKKLDFNYELSFSVYNKNKLESVILPSAMAQHDLLSTIDILLKEVDSYQPNVEGEYFLYYKKYNYYPLSNYKVSTESAKKDLKNDLEKKRLVIQNGELKSEELTTLDHYFINYSCLEIFQSDWQLRPALSFSNNLINEVFKSEHELLYNHYLYDGVPTNPNFLPIFKPLAVHDDAIINPHYIDVKQAKKLMSILEKYFPKDGDNYKKEIEFFKTLLNKVVKDQIVLVLNNYSQ